MTSTALDAFGYAVRKARLELGWNMGALAEETHGNGACKGQMDKGLRSLSSETNEKFEQALSHHEYLAKARHIVPKIDALTPKETKFPER